MNLQNIDIQVVIFPLFFFKTNDLFLTEKQSVRHRETLCSSVSNESTNKIRCVKQRTRPSFSVLQIVS